GGRLRPHPEVGGGLQVLGHSAGLRRPHEALADGSPAIAVPRGIGVVDTMIGLPSVERRDWQASMAGVLRDEGSRAFEHPAGYMFKETPTVGREPDSIDRLLPEMDRFGAERG